LLIRKKDLQLKKYLLLFNIPKILDNIYFLSNSTKENIPESDILLSNENEEAFNELSKEENKLKDIQEKNEIQEEPSCEENNQKLLKEIIQQEHLNVDIKLDNIDKIDEKLIEDLNKNENDQNVNLVENKGNIESDKINDKINNKINDEEALK